MNKELYENTIRIQFEMINELNEKIDKAIEYIKSYLPNYDFDYNNLEKLLEILGGE